MSGIDPIQFQEVYNLVISTASANTISNIIQKNNNKHQMIITVIAGTLVAIIGQTINTFLIKPIRNYQILKEKINYKLNYYFHTSFNMSLFMSLLNNSDRREILKLCSKLESIYLAIPWNSFFSKIKLIPKREDIRIATSLLNDLYLYGSSSGKFKENRERIQSIKKILNLKFKD